MAAELQKRSRYAADPVGAGSVGADFAYRRSPRGPCDCNDDALGVRRRSPAYVELVLEVSGHVHQHAEGVVAEILRAGESGDGIGVDVDDC